MHEELAIFWTNKYNQKKTVEFLQKLPRRSFQKLFKETIQKRIQEMLNDGFTKWKQTGLEVGL